MSKTSKYECPLIPKSGEQWFSVNLSWLKTMTVAECLGGLEKLGYSPELRYRQNPNGSIDLIAVLGHWENQTVTQVSHEEHRRVWELFGDENDIALSLRSKNLRDLEAETWQALPPEERARICKESGN